MRSGSWVSSVFVGMFFISINGCQVGERKELVTSLTPEQAQQKLESRIERSQEIRDNIKTLRTKLEDFETVLREVDKALLKAHDGAKYKTHAVISNLRQALVDSTEGLVKEVDSNLYIIEKQIKIELESGIERALNLKVESEKHHSGQTISILVSKVDSDELLRLVTLEVKSEGGIRFEIHNDNLTAISEQFYGSRSDKNCYYDIEKEYSYMHCEAIEWILPSDGILTLNDFSLNLMQGKKPVTGGSLLVTDSDGNVVLTGDLSSHKYSVKKK